MSLHYLNPDDAPRACPGCINCADPITVTADEGCDGTGRVNADAKPDVETREVKPSRLRQRRFKAGWYYMPPRTVGQGIGPYPTELAALDAARKSQP